MTHYQFADFRLDARNRRLLRGHETIDLSPRYFDALLLLVQNAGQLVSKTQFMAQVWHGTVVGDEALTQCIRSLRKALGDSAANATFIETVPKHGYRFVAVVTEHHDVQTTISVTPPANLFSIGGAGTLGAGAAGIIGGAVLGVIHASFNPSVGTLSVLLVIMSITLLLALLAGAGVAFGAGALYCLPAKIGAISRFLAHQNGAKALFLLGVGAIAGGFMVGAVVNFIALDSLALLMGRSPTALTGAWEGLLIGMGVAASLWLSRPLVMHGRQVFGLATPIAVIILASIVGAASGGLIYATGGQLLSGSLQQLTTEFPPARLPFYQLAESLGSDLLLLVSTCLEASIFTVGVCSGIHFALRRSAR